jgi:Uma2 family endonuclease
MQITAKAQFASNVGRWHQLLADRKLAKLPHRIETDRLGRIVLTPLPSFGHAWRVSTIIELLHEHLPVGKTLSETPISTADGVKVMDVAWLGSDYAKVLEQSRPLILERAPQICIEVLSESNSPEGIAEKRAFYFEAGAKEVWICELDGRMSFYCRGELAAGSEICSRFPKQL